jgi:hypothetical protein
MAVPLLAPAAAAAAAAAPAAPAAATAKVGGGRNLKDSSYGAVVWCR